MPALSRPQLARLWRRLGIPPDYPQTRGLPVQREATRLVFLARAHDDGKLIRLTPPAALAWRKMQAAAAVAGVTLLPLSGFRSVRRQARIVRQKLAAGRAIGDILRSVAAPGCSEHHTGRALDIGSPEHIELDEDFARTAAFRWLKRHAARFGFHLSYPRHNANGIVYEPWHWCWRAKKKLKRRESTRQRPSH